MPAPDDEFHRIMNEEFPVNDSREYIDATPYGGHARSHKPGLTKRGKAALGIGAAVLAGGGLIGYQAYSANVAANEAKAQEIALKSQQLELEKLKELNRVNAADRKAENSENKTRQTSINECVKDKEDQVGKDFGSPSYQDVVDACQSQYAPTTSGDDMETAASAKEAASPGGGGVNEGLLVGGGALALFLVGVVKKGKRSNPA
ncbi:hypothetical protein ACWY4P_53860 (plasmid) [Streptomyces sp. LZ34]